MERRRKMQQTKINSAHPETGHVIMMNSIKDCRIHAEVSVSVRIGVKKEKDKN